MKEWTAIKIGRSVSGEAVVRVPLSADRGHALVDWVDYGALIESGASTTWFLNSNGTGREYVRAYQLNASGGLVGIARVILGVGANQVVRYRDNDPTNLRRSNLVAEEGRAKRTDHRIIETLTGNLRAIEEVASAAA